MRRSIVLIGMTWAVATVPAVAQQVIQAGSNAELREKFCNADPRKELVLVLPARLFVDSEQVICEADPYKLYRIVSVYDTDDFEYWLDPHVRVREWLGVLDSPWFLGLVVGVVMSHFIVDAGIWRLREPFQRGYMRRKFDFVFR